jgi:hypothetical protein
LFVCFKGLVGGHGLPIGAHEIAKQALLVRTDWRADAVLARAKAGFDCRKIFFATPIFSQNRAPTRAHGLARQRASLAANG